MALLTGYRDIIKISEIFFSIEKILTLISCQKKFTIIFTRHNIQWFLFSHKAESQNNMERSSGW